MYSRYIPPSKKKVQVKEQFVEPLRTAVKQSSPPPPPAAIRPDASSTYARYVPPSKSKTKSSAQPISESTGPESPSSNSKRKLDDVIESNPEPASKKAKKNKKEKSAKKSEAFPPFEEINTHIRLKDKADDVIQEEKVPKRKKRKEEKSDPPNEVEDSEQDADDKRHKKVLDKRERSLKKAEKRARKRAEDGLDDDEDETESPTAEVHDLVPLPQPEPVPELPPPSLESTLPSWLASPILVSPTATAQFSQIGVEEHVAKFLQSKGFNEAFAVQAAVLPLLLSSSQHKPGDVLVSAATGSGKTLSYVLPMIEGISHNVVTRLRGLIVMPTRELVSQAREVCEVCASAFASGGRKRVKIGTAVGNETFKLEQSLLMENQYLYDPERYREQKRRLDAKWESSDAETDEEDGTLGDDETMSTLPDHIIEPVPKVDVLICTPGRLVEHLKSTLGFTLQYIKWLIIDEADKLLDQSFQQWLSVVMTALGGQNNGLRGPDSRERVRKVVLSATMTRDIGQLTSLKLYRPKLVVLEGSTNSTQENDGKSSQAHILPSLLVEYAIRVDDEDLKPLYLTEILASNDMINTEVDSDSDSDSDSQSEDSSSSDDDSSDNSSSSSESSDSDSDSSTASSVNSPRSTSLPDKKLNPVVEPSHQEPRGVLIFTKSNETAVRLGRLISLIYPKYTNLIGTLTSTTRSSTRKSYLNSFHSGKLSILVASDLVSRGLDLPNLAHVINYDVPTSITSYVHRVGRTARAGKPGSSWTLISNTEARWFWNEIARSEGIKRAEGSKVKRINIDARKFGEGQKESYEVALEALGREAMATRSRKMKA